MGNFECEPQRRSNNLAGFGYLGVKTQVFLLSEVSLMFQNLVEPLRPLTLPNRNAVTATRNLQGNVFLFGFLSLVRWEMS